MDTVLLNNNVEMPLLAFGVFQITNSEVCKQSVMTALQTGYRLIDTAACYGNEKAVGEAIRQSGISRQDIFIVSKVWIQDAGYEKTMASFEKTLLNLQTHYLDLYAIWRLSWKLACNETAVKRKKSTCDWCLQFFAGSLCRFNFIS